MKKQLILTALLAGSWVQAKTTPFANTSALEIVSRQEAVFQSPPSPRTVGQSSHAVSAPLLGNGDLGVCITGNPATQLFWVTKNDFWWLKNGAAVPLNFGTLRIAIPALTNATYAARQSLVDAKTVATFTGKDSTITETSFVAATANILVVTLTCTGKPVTVGIAFQPNTFANHPETDRQGEEKGCHWATRAFAQDVDIPLETTVAWKLSGAAGETFTLEPDKPVTLLLAMASSFDDRKPLKRTLAILNKANPVALESAHKAWWHKFHGNSFVEIPDPEIMRRYYLSQYTMGCASRNPNFPPAIIGPWATSQTGWCGYWMNYNHAAPYYALYSSNHIAQADPQDTPMLEFMPVGKQHATDILKCRGFLYPVGLGPNGLDASGLAAKTVTNNRFEKGVCTWGQRSNTAYNLLNMAQRWYSTYDPDYARKIAPYVLGVVEFWEDYLTLENGRYVINNESVHEGSGKNKNPVSTLGLVRSAFHLALDMSNELGVDDTRRAKWQDILNRLSDYPTKEHSGKTIFILSEQGPVLWHNNTVHIQHIYPAGQIGLDSDPKLLTIARNTLEATPRWHDHNGANSFFPMAARIGYTPDAILRELHSYSTGGMAPNGFSRGNPHGLENCSTVPNTINEMLMQSQEGVIRLFPVWPKDKDAKFGTLRARGAFLVSAELKGGLVSGVKILSEKGRDLTIVNPWPGKKAKIVRAGEKETTMAGNRLTLKTAVKETIELNPE